MTSHWKKDHQHHLWNTEKPIAIPRHDDEDDQDIYISERSSIASSDDLSITVHAVGKPLSTPSPPMVLLQKGTQLPRYAQRGSPESGPVPMTYIQLDRQEEKIVKKPRRKPPAPAPGALTAVFETKTSESGSHHPVYGVYHKIKVPDRMGRHRGLPDGQATSHDSFDTPQQAAQASLTTSTIKPTPAPRPSRREAVPTNLSHHLIHHDNDHSPQKTSPRQSNGGGRETENDERRDHSNRRTMPQQRHKPKINHDWADPHVQSFSNKSPQEAETLIITSNSSNTRSTNRPKIIEKNSVRHETDDSSSKHRHYPNHSPSIPSQPNHHHHHYAHIRRRPPSGVHMTAELPLVDVSSKKFERSSQFQHTRDLFRVSPSPPAPIYNPSSTSYLPPIGRDHHTKANIARFPNEYYGTLARQTHVKDWEESIEIPKIYKADPHGRFYDRYLHAMPDKRLVA